MKFTLVRADRSNIFINHYFEFVVQILCAMAASLIVVSSASVGNQDNQMHSDSTFLTHDMEAGETRGIIIRVVIRNVVRHLFRSLRSR